MRRALWLWFLLLSLVLGGCSADIGSIGNSASTGKVDTAQSLEDIPDYSASPYVEVNGNQPDFSEADKKRTDAFEEYSELDDLGRCGEAYANICRELMPTKEREGIGQVRPSGWRTVKYNDLIDGNYLYNRCHLIGYQLAGENANERNLITGTRYLNVEGMLPFEDQVDDYVDSTHNHVLYRVTPIFHKDNLVASGVEMEAWSVEDKGKGVCFHVYCYNVQPGIAIDYATGDSHKSDDASGNAGNTKGTGGRKKDASSAGKETEKMDVVLNTNTKKIHLPTCFSVKDMADSNKKERKATIPELEKEGYSACGNCLPGYR